MKVCIFFVILAFFLMVNRYIILIIFVILLFWWFQEFLSSRSSVLLVIYLTLFFFLNPTSSFFFNNNSPIHSCWVLPFLSVLAFANLPFSYISILNTVIFLFFATSHVSWSCPQAMLPDYSATVPAFILSPDPLAQFAAISYTHLFFFVLPLRNLS